MRKTGKLVVGLASLTLFDLSSAHAIDLPPVWSGFYIGAHAGYRWANSNFSSPAYDFDPGGGIITSPARNERYSLNSGIVGVQAGYNVMLTPGILAGVESDWSWGSGEDVVARTFSGSSNDGFVFRGTSILQLTWQATIRGRLGVVNGPWLYYGTAGVAFAHAKWTDYSRLDSFFTTVTASSSADKTLVGWALGGGVEYMFAANWSGRAEYLYENFGDFTAPHGFGPQLGTVSLRDIHKLRFAINYKLGR